MHLCKQGDHKHFSSENSVSHDSNYFNSNRENRSQKLHSALLPDARLHSAEAIFHMHATQEFPKCILLKHLSCLKNEVVKIFPPPHTPNVFIHSCV